MALGVIGYDGFLGWLGSSADINRTFNVPQSATTFAPIEIQMQRSLLVGAALDVDNSEWDSYTLTEVSDPNNVGSATLVNGTNDLNGAQTDGVNTLINNRNDWQHDTVRFQLDTSSAAWKNLAVGQSLTVTYRVDAREYVGVWPLEAQTDSDSLNITFTFTKTCFAADSMILMADGSEKRADAVQVGDLIATVDRGAQPVRWVGVNTVMRAEMKHFAQWRPIRIAAGALGEGLPAQDLLVSQLHRVLVSGEVAEQNFGAPEVLVPARFLTALDGIDVIEAEDDLTYVHFMFDNHEIVWANGARSESFYVSPMSRSQIGEAQLAELESLFPELGRMAREGTPEPARPFVRGDAALELASAHMTRRLPLQ